MVAGDCIHFVSMYPCGVHVTSMHVASELYVAVRGACCHLLCLRCCHLYSMSVSVLHVSYMLYVHAASTHHHASYLKQSPNWCITFSHRLLLCAYVYRDACTHVRSHPRPNSGLHSRVHTCLHTCLRACLHKCLHECPHIRLCTCLLYTHLCTCLDTCPKHMSVRFGVRLPLVGRAQLRSRPRTIHVVIINRYPLSDVSL